MSIMFGELCFACFMFIKLSPKKGRQDIRKNLMIYQPPAPTLGGKVFLDICKLLTIASNFLYIKKKSYDLSTPYPHSWGKVFLDIS